MTSNSERVAAWIVLSCVILIVVIDIYRLVALFEVEYQLDHMEETLEVNQKRLDQIILRLPVATP